MFNISTIQMSVVLFLPLDQWAPHFYRSGIFFQVCRSITPSERLPKMPQRARSRVASSIFATSTPMVAASGAELTAAVHFSKRQRNPMQIDLTASHALLTGRLGTHDPTAKKRTSWPRYQPSYRMRQFVQKSRIPSCPRL